MNSGGPSDYPTPLINLQFNTNNFTTQNLNELEIFDRQNPKSKPKEKFIRKCKNFNTKEMKKYVEANVLYNSMQIGIESNGANNL